VNGSFKDCFLVAKNLDMSGSFITKTLMKLRGLPVKDLTLQGFIKDIRFTYLEEHLYEEFVIDASQPRIKIIWNFHFQEVQNKTLVSTETRILCLNKRSKFFFSIYWFFVKPFSGIIRLEMLRLIKIKVEKLTELG
jgi:hypothetical protein